MTTAKYPQECDIVAILTPKEGKQDRVIELLTNLTAAVKRNEPDVFTFHLYKDFDAGTNKEQLVLVEKYADKAAYDLHAELPEFQAMHKSFKDDELMERPIVIKSVKPVAGFYREGWEGK